MVFSRSKPRNIFHHLLEEWGLLSSGWPVQNECESAQMALWAAILRGEEEWMSEVVGHPVV